MTSPESPTTDSQAQQIIADCIENNYKSFFFQIYNLRRKFSGIEIKSLTEKIITFFINLKNIKTTKSITILLKNFKIIVSFDNNIIANIYQDMQEILLTLSLTIRTYADIRVQKLIV